MADIQPKFTRQEINKIKDHLLTMNLDKESVDSTGSFDEKCTSLMELFYPTSNSGVTPLHHDAHMEEIQHESSNNPTSDSGVTPPYQAAAAPLPYTVDSC